MTRKSDICVVTKEALFSYVLKNVVHKSTNPLEVFKLHLL